jgi:hypothetical protein
MPHWEDDPDFAMEGHVHRVTLQAPGDDAALAGAVSAYLREHHGAPVDIPTMVPVNIRPLDEPLPRELGNKFALVILTLPSGLTTPFARLAETKRRMDAIKGSPEALITFGMIRGIGRTGPRVERLLVDFFANKVSGVTTNVPGPRTTRYVAGTRITQVLGWAPESGNQTLGTSIFTYADSVFVGFKVDTATIAHPEELVAAFVEEIETLCRIGGPEEVALPEQPTDSPVAVRPAGPGVRPVARPVVSPAVGPVVGPAVSPGPRTRR